MQSEVALILGNLQTNDPWYNYIAGTTTISGYLNRCANEFIRMAVGGNGHNLDLFPELKNAWTVGPTTAGVNVIANPTDALVVQTVHRAETSTLPNWATTRELPLSYLAPEEFGVLTKDATVIGYAKLFTRRGKSILIHPTPDSTHIDYLRFYGLRQETPLVNSTDTFFVDGMWHDAIVTLAAQRLALRMGHSDQAAELMTQIEQMLQQTANETALEKNEGQAMVDGTPSRETVYGGV